MRFRWPAALVSLGFLSSCVPPESSPDPSDPVTIEDLQPMPPEVTSGNARLVVRIGLQAHRRGNSSPDDQVGYAFRDAGFVQLVTHAPPDRAERRTSRLFVQYGSIRSVTVEPYFDLQFIKDRFRITLKGSFQKWEAPARPSEPLPGLGLEPRVMPVDVFILSLDDAVVAKRLTEALLLLSKS